MNAIKSSNDYINELVKKARTAQAEFENATQEKVDEAVKVIAKVVYDNAEMLAEMAVEETGLGNYPDKVAKNKGKSRVIWNNLKGKKSRGVLERDEATGITKVAKPIGVVGAITPCTNPIVTPMSNAMFALKCGNAIIVSPHPRAKKCSTKTVEMMRAELKKIGLNPDLIQVISDPSIEATNALMPMVDVVIATGGMGMVKAVYSSGRPALGVGAGNVQVILDRDVNYAEAVPKIVAGRSFDNGIICSGEQTAICPAEKFDEIMDIFEKNHGYVVRDKEEVAKFRNVIFNEKGAMNPDALGQSAQKVAALAGVEIPEETKVIVLEADGFGMDDLLAKEKMCPCIAAYKYDSFEDGVAIAKANLEREGKGHSVSIHSENVADIEYAAEQLSASRFVVNQVCASSAGGSFNNGLAPTNTLGCGSWGNNSISENLDYKHLMNVSRIAYFMKDNPVPTDEELWA